MLTIRCRTRLFAMLFCLPLGLCVANTARAASDDDEDWRDTKGPRSDNGGSDDSDSEKKSKKSSGDAQRDSDKASNRDSDKGDDAKVSTKGKDKAKHKEPPSDTKMSVALLVSYGLPVAQAMGIGVRGGIHIKSVVPLYFGAVGQYFLGSRSSNKSLGTKSTTLERFMYFGGEGGVDFDLATDLRLRPFLGFGLGFDKDEVCPSGQECEGDTKLHPTVTPGVVGLYHLDSFFFGIDVRYIIVAGAGTTGGVAFSGTGGLML